MKKRKYYCKLLLALTLTGIFPGAQVLAQQYEKSRNVSGTFPANNETTVQIINKYGNVHVLPWDKDSVRIDVNIKVESSKQSKVEKTFDNIEIEFSESSYYVIGETILGNQKSAFWADVSDFTNSMLNSGSNAQIDYKVYIPEDVELSIELKFGNIYMTDHYGKCIVTISNGDFRGGNFRQLELDHSFGNVVIDTVQAGTFNLSYTELRLDRAGELRIESKSSKPNIQSFRSIRMNSRRDTYYFEDAGTINGETSFSYMTIENLESDLILNTNYGSLNIDNFGKSFSMMNLAASYTDVNMICSTGYGCYLEIYHDHKTRMIYPQNNSSLKDEESDSEDGDYLLNGHLGQAGEDSPRIKISINGGSIKLVHHNQ